MGITTENDGEVFNTTPTTPFCETTPISGLTPCMEPLFTVMKLFGPEKLTLITSAGTNENLEAGMESLRKAFVVNVSLCVSDK
ncbi:hypothetical protein SDC9_177296 [bioreactor metagenome]|uniref:Uncharacterized protein n=1 Tax=bioreactor metagenome TaxID=1076179 RepID=A0A645H1X2_9ZZZZ